MVNKFCYNAFCKDYYHIIWRDLFMNLKIANDNGNSEHDLIIDGKLVQQPNVFAKIMRVPNLDDVNKEYVLKNLHDNLLVSIEGGLYYIGQRALESGQPCRAIEVGVDNNKVTSDIVYINTLAHSAAAAIEEAAGKDYDLSALDETITAHVDMATALPVSYFNKKNCQTFSEKFTGKKHHVCVYIGDKEVMVELIYDFVKVIPEGVTASFALKENNELFEEYNKQHKEAPLDKADFAENKVLHIAVGEGTTEFPVTTDVHFKPDFISGTNNGNGHAIDAVIDDFKEQFGLMKLTRQEYSDILQDEGHKYHATAVEFIMPALENQAEEILHKAKQVIQQANNEIDVVCVYGGGSIMMREALEKKLKDFCDRAMIKLLYMPKKYAVTLEVSGLNVFLNSKVFAALKEASAANN